MGALIVMGALINKNTFEGGAYLKGGAYWKKGAKSKVSIIMILEVISLYYQLKDFNPPFCF